MNHSMLVETSLGNIVPMFQRAMPLAVVFVLSVIHPMKWHLLLRATAYMKGNHGSVTLHLEKRKKFPVFVIIYLVCYLTLILHSRCLFTTGGRYL